MILIFMATVNCETYFSSKPISGCYALNLVRQSLYILVRSSLAIDRIGLLFWLKFSFAITHPLKLRSIVENAIDLFTSEDRYFLWIAAVPLFAITTTFVDAHAPIGVTVVIRWPPNLRPVSSRQLDAVTVLWTRYISNNVYFQSHLLCWKKNPLQSN